MSRRSLSPPPLPHEHGAWFMLGMPLALGLGASWQPSAGKAPGVAAWCVVPALLLILLARYAALPAAERLVSGKPAAADFFRRRFLWTAVYGTGSVITLGLAILLAPVGSRGAVLLTSASAAILGAFHTLLALRGLDRTLGGEVLGMAGLACSAPLVVVASGSPLDGEAVGLGLIALVFFTSSLACVRAWRIRAERPRSALLGSLGAHACLAVAVVGLWYRGWVPTMAIAAYGVVIARALWTLLAPPESVRHLGWREALASVLFFGLVLGGLLL